MQTDNDIMMDAHTRPAGVWRRVLARLRRLTRRSAVGSDSGLMPRMDHTDIRLLSASAANVHMQVRLGRRPFQVADPIWDLHSYHEILVNEIYRFEAQTDSPLIFDCGANIGFSVVYFKHLYPCARVMAFEPEPTLCSMLQQNIKSMGLTGVEVHRSAIWTENSTLTFTSNGSVGGHLTRESDDRPGQVVSTARLRDLLDQHVDLLKLDIEGAEDAVLRDCAEKLANVDHLFFEYHGLSREPQTLDDLLSLCRASGFRYHIREANPTKHPFLKSERHPVYDLQLNVYAYRDFD